MGSFWGRKDGQSQIMGTRDKDQQYKVLAAPAGDLSSGPSAYINCTATYNSSSRRAGTLSGLCGYPHTSGRPHSRQTDMHERRYKPLKLDYAEVSDDCVTAQTLVNYALEVVKSCSINYSSRKHLENKTHEPLGVWLRNGGSCTSEILYWPRPLCQLLLGVHAELK